MNSLKVVVERAAVVVEEEEAFSEFTELTVAPPFGVNLPREY